MINLDQLYRSTFNASREELKPFVAPLNERFKKYEVNNYLRICHFLAQVCHESGEFRYQEELASGADYEFRTDLGNTEAGDGQRFKGRGLIQVTGFYNYQAISLDTGIDYLNNPDWLAELPHCVESAFWYWDKHSLNDHADADDIDRITRIINGGYNGLEDRINYLHAAKDALTHLL
ncbi:glycoside hydrolase family 19 protein [Chroococcidiopsis sp.]|uniref:glycoside hydrolase family 19 protein n=1 Tax=Chroococcidiopsis sp. TaxID=3088168 RepID=UPI003F3BE557